MNFEVLPLVLQVDTNYDYVLSRLWDMGILSASKRDVHPLCREYALLPLHLLHGVCFAYGGDISKQILLFVLEIQNTVFLLFRHQCRANSGMELEHNKKYDRFLLYGYGSDGILLFLWLC